MTNILFWKLVMKQIFPDKNHVCVWTFKLITCMFLDFWNILMGKLHTGFFCIQHFWNRIKDYNYCTVTNVMLRNGVINHSVTNIFSVLLCKSPRLFTMTETQSWETLHSCVSHWKHLEFYVWIIFQIRRDNPQFQEMALSSFELCALEKWMALEEQVLQPA